MAVVVPTPPSDSTDRLVNAAVIVAVVILALIAFHWLIDTTALKTDLIRDLGNPTKEVAARQQLESLQSQATAIFGTFTTFLGTAIGAFFGIAASASATKSATNTVSSLAQQNATAQAQNSELQRQFAQKSQSLDEMKNGIASLDPTKANYAADIAHLKAMQ
jgi:hypothetical protein